MIHRWLSTDCGDSCLVCGVDVCNPHMNDADELLPTAALHWSASNDTCLPPCPGLLDLDDEVSTTHHFGVTDLANGTITCHNCTLTIDPETPFADVSWACPRN